MNEGWQVPKTSLGIVSKILGIKERKIVWFFIKIQDFRCNLSQMAAGWVILRMVLDVRTAWSQKSQIYSFRKFNHNNLAENSLIAHNLLPIHQSTSKPLPMLHITMLLGTKLLKRILLARYTLSPKTYLIKDISTGKMWHKRHFTFLCALSSSTIIITVIMIILIIWQMAIKNEHYIVQT